MATRAHSVIPFNFFDPNTGHVTEWQETSIINEDDVRFVPLQDDSACISFMKEKHANGYEKWLKWVEVENKTLVKPLQWVELSDNVYRFHLQERTCEIRIKKELDTCGCVPMTCTSCIFVVSMGDGLRYRAAWNPFMDAIVWVTNVNEDASDKLLAPLTKEMQCLLLLTILKAIADTGDRISLHCIWRAARLCAYQEKRESKYAVAIDIILPKLLHPQDIIYFAVEAGEAHEAAALRLEKNCDIEASKIEMLAAIKAYKIGAMACISNDTISARGSRGHIFNCLAVALTRIGELDMAARAYMWALSDPHKTSIETKTLCKNISNLWREKKGKITQKQRKMHNRRCIRAQMTTEHHVIEDPKCSNPECCTSVKPLKRCSNCKMTAYCSKACQVADWTLHKKSCKAWRAQKEKIEINLS